MLDSAASFQIEADSLPLCGADDPLELRVLVRCHKEKRGRLDALTSLKL